MNITKKSLSLAEDEGFEPSKAFTLLPFQGSALGRYANPPMHTFTHLFILHIILYNLYIISYKVYTT